MTTLVAVRKNGFVALASDSQVTSGWTSINMETPKIYAVGGAYIGFCGSVSNFVAINHYITTMPREPELVTSSDLFEFGLELHQSLKERYFLSPKDSSGMEAIDVDMVAITCKGVFSVDGDRCVLEHSRLMADGSGQSFALGAAEALYPTEMDALGIARQAVKIASRYDLGTGGPVQKARLKLE